MERFRAVRCLTALTALPYSRLHPFKTQVNDGLRQIQRGFHDAGGLASLLRAHRSVRRRLPRRYLTFLYEFLVSLKAMCLQVFFA